MSRMIRFRHLVAIPALLIAVGCASTTTNSAGEAAGEANAPGAVTIRDASSATLEPVYFDTDRALLRPEAREALKRYAESILDHSEWGVLTIDGHCDERGSAEYNLALGKRRAAAVQRYLTDLGVPPSQLTTRSFGEEKPAAAGHEEGAWSRNRRSELQPESRESASR